ncbi:MAG: hypothetical protein LBI42_13800 [Chitinispirillales bacterium]|nr:hypothetical protein [Chitinispirillales bacterium]
MKILVTVGAKKYDSLVEYIDSKSEFNDLSIEFQIAKGKYIPKNNPYFTFTDSADFERKILEADAVITNAEAETIYKLLEMKKRFIIVPHFGKLKKHQVKIINFVWKSRYAFVANEFIQLKILLEIISDYNFSEYSKESFSKAEEILEFLLS